MKRAISLVCAIGAVLVFSIPAEAAKPTRAFLLNSPFDLQGVCSFTVHFDFPVSNEFIKTYFDNSGVMTRQKITGNLVATSTNNTTGTSLTSNISGPATFVFYLDGNLKSLVGDGAQIEITPDNRLLLGSGHIVQSYADDASNTLLGETRTGNFIDLCAALA